MAVVDTSCDVDDSTYRTQRRGQPKPVTARFTTLSAQSR